MLKPKSNEGKQDFLTRCTAEIKASGGKDADDAFSACVLAWDAAKGNKRALHLSSELELKKGDGEAPGSFHIAAYTGKPIIRWGEKFVIDVDGIKARAKMPILLEHMSNQRVGYSTRTWKEQANFLVAGKFSQATPYGIEVQGLAEDGYPWEASIGVKALRVERLKTEKEKAQVNGYTLSGPAEIWRESKVFEVSFTNQGADDETAAINMTEDDTENSQTTEERKMDAKTLKDEHKDVYEEVFTLGASSVDQDALREAGVVPGMEYGAALEQARVLGLLTAHLGEEAAEKFRAIVETGVSVEQLSAIQAANPPQTEVPPDQMAAMLAAIQAAGSENPGAGGGAQNQMGDFEAEVAKLMASEGIGKGAATRAIADKHPEIHEAYLKKLRGDTPLQ